MIKRTLYFASPAYLSSRKQQLVVQYPDTKEERTVPIEDVGLLVLESHRITLSHRLISLLLGNNVAIVTCDEQHLPQGMILNLNASYTQQEHFRVQVEASQALKDRLWKQTIQSKIRNQAALLNQNGIAVESMNRWADKVQNGDPDNFESRAAVYHWKCLFTDLIQNFKRGRFEGEPNNLLNYGYSILRATVARSLLASGLLPTFGYHHRNKYNAYCLADDVMEPYRPYVDELVLELVRSTDDYQVLTPALKQKLLQVPVLDVMINGKQSPLMLAVQQTTASLYQCYAREQKEIKFPKF